MQRTILCLNGVVTSRRYRLFFQVGASGPLSTRPLESVLTVRVIALRSSTSVYAKGCFLSILHAYAHWRRRLRPRHLHPLRPRRLQCRPTQHRFHQWLPATSSSAYATTPNGKRKKRAQNPQSAASFTRPPTRPTSRVVGSRIRRQRAHART